MKNRSLHFLIGAALIQLGCKPTNSSFFADENPSINAIVKMIEPSPMENLEENTIEIYSNWKDKGELVNGGRITLVADKTQLEVGDTLEVLHVFEWIVEGQELFVMGPKEVPNEFVNGKLQTKAPSDGDTYPWVGIYDGVVLPSPGLDANWLPSRYVMEHAGTCTVQWKAGSWTSNELVVQVR